jgi:hypothetical protein
MKPKVSGKIRLVVCKTCKRIYDWENVQEYGCSHCQRDKQQLEIFGKEAGKDFSQVICASAS